MNKIEEVAYRKLLESDLDEVMRIENEVYRHGWTRGIFSDCLNVGYLCWAIEINDTLIGYMILSIAVDEAHILNIAIDPLYQGQGIGSQSMMFLINQSRVARAEAAFLEVRPSNMSAISLYEKLGFSEVGCRKDYYPADNGREDALIMAKPLTTDYNLTVESSG